MPSQAHEKPLKRPSQAHDATHERLLEVARRKLARREPARRELACGLALWELLEVAHDGLIEAAHPVHVGEHDGLIEQRWE